ncbi:uncharacterized protein CMU_036390 [Cryptosporidium muris RN66]|uniref:Uncharacterized protein n=1 Tax=Cryptosporidium muris (strain RN66) TaxID=441375 RepID=B6AGX4_CRYMR|nr:uncharacterized protein CMU_036390 [Cryptosporidium muris RN66]EEA07465.1 hypothetical protein, conserved [Cryptosporidium muris RN66]|eukprot:XP_002141814.1 hypothetical protein [Cryptosporidium muris RN66]
MWNIVMGLCCSSENTLPSSSLPLEWCSGITNQEDSNEVQSNKLSIDSHELENMVKLFTKRAINGVSLSIYDKTSQSFVDGKYFINRNLGILTLKTVTETVIIPFKAVSIIQF